MKRLMDRLPKFGFASLFDFVRPHIQANAKASLAYQAAGLRIYSVAPPAHAGD